MISEDLYIYAEKDSRNGHISKYGKGRNNIKEVKIIE